MDIINKFTLNKEQSQTFHIIANHASKPSGEHLKMYLRGMASIGKLQIIKALMHFFNKQIHLLNGSLLHKFTVRYSVMPSRLSSIKSLTDTLNECFAPFVLAVAETSLSVNEL